jgi:tetratricopeptide (TPR) repeat protein
MNMTALVEQFEAALAAAGDDAQVDLRLLSRDDALGLAESVKKLALTDVPRAERVSGRMAEFPVEDAGIRVQWLAARAHVLCYANRFEDAASCLASAAQIADAHGADRDIGQVMLASIQPLARLGKLREADIAAKRAMEAYEACGDQLACGKAALNRGIVLRMLGELPASLASFDRACDLVGEDLFLRGALSSNRAEVLLDLDRFAYAEAAMSDASEAFATGGHAHAAAIVEGNRADLLSREGRIDEAMESFERAKGMFESAGAGADVARLESEQAEALAAIGAFAGSVATYASAIPRLESGGLMRELARSRLGLGHSMRALGATTQARATLETALAELLAVNADDLAAECRLTLALMGLEFTRDESAAAAMVAPVIEQFAARPVRCARAHAEIGEACLAHGLTDLASHHAEAGALIDASSALLPLRARSARLRGRVLLRTGQHEKGFAALQASMRDADRMRGSLRVESLRLACGESWRDLYMEVCAAALDGATSESDLVAMTGAFEALERLRSRTLLDALGGTCVPHAETGASATRQRLDRCTDELNVLYNRVGVGRGDDTADVARLGQLEKEAETLRQRLAALEGSALLPSEPSSLDLACESIDHATTVLTFWPDGDAISVLVVQRGSARVIRRFVAASEVASLLRRQRFCLNLLLRGEAASDVHDAWHAIAAGLGAAVLGPLESVLRGADRVALSTFGLLEELPWAMLEVGGQNLGSRHTLLQIPGVSAALAIGKQSAGASTGHRLLAVGVPDALAPLMAEEAATVAATSRDPLLLSGEAATAAAVLAAMQRADRVHIAAHCVYSDHSPMSSRMRFADRWVTARELAAALRPGATVALAGCESGRTGGPATDDRLGLIRALLGAGASAVLASRWPLHDQFSLDAMAALHTVLERGEHDLASALRCLREDFTAQSVPTWLHGGLFVTGGLSS